MGCVEHHCATLQRTLTPLYSPIIQTNLPNQSKYEMCCPLPCVSGRTKIDDYGLSKEGSFFTPQTVRESQPSPPSFHCFRHISPSARAKPDEEKVSENDKEGFKQGYLLYRWLSLFLFLCHAVLFRIFVVCIVLIYFQPWVSHQDWKGRYYKLIYKKSFIINYIMLYYYNK